MNTAFTALTAADLVRGFELHEQVPQVHADHVTGAEQHERDH